MFVLRKPGAVLTYSWLGFHRAWVELRQIGLNARFCLTFNFQTTLIFKLIFIFVRVQYVIFPFVSSLPHIMFYLIVITYIYIHFCIKKYMFIYKNTWYCKEQILTWYNYIIMSKTYFKKQSSLEVESKDEAVILTCCLSHLRLCCSHVRDGSQSIASGFLSLKNGQI